MKRTVQQILNDIVHRIYPRDSQYPARTILNAYFSQTSDCSRRMTLDSLGKLKELKKPVTRERARQIRDNFLEKDFPKEISRLNRGVALNDSLMTNHRQDLDELIKTSSIIIDIINETPLPIFSDRIQTKLSDLGLIEKDSYIPILLDLAKSFKIEKNFELHEHKGIRVIIETGKKIKSYTDDIIQYAGKRATHLGGVLSFDSLFNNDWDDNGPDALKALSPDVKKQYLTDLLSSEEDIIFLQDNSFFAFQNRDERVSSILLPIFFTYKSAIQKDVLLDAIISNLSHRFMTKPDTDKRDYELNFIRSCRDALDEYCLRTLLLDSVDNDYRAPGLKLLSKLIGYEPGEYYQAQMMVVNKIKEFGEPIPSMKFGKICENELKIKPSLKSSIFTYPTLYYKDGSGRRKNLYKTLDSIYKPDDLQRKNSTNENIILSNEIEKKINEVQVEINKVKDGNDPLAIIKVRQEQSLLRKYLIITSNKEGQNKSSGKCLICNKYFPTDLLVASHVKKRYKCSDIEKADIRNIAMLQCVLCDKLFENGYIYLTNSGVVKVNQNIKSTEDLKIYLSKIDGNSSEYINGSANRIEYIEFHRAESLNKKPQS